MVDLAELDPSAVGRFGGKAAGLARLLAAGAAVPPGFALGAPLPPPSRWTRAERAAFRARVAALLCGGPLAVRSSGRDEDGAERSLAGLFESVLDVRSEAVAEAALARCLASAEGERARAHGVGGARGLGVVVQRLVAARAAGVLFTADPQGRHRGALLEAVPGAGEALVSGRSAPERWGVHRAGSGALEAQLEAAAPGAPALAPGEAMALARGGLALAERLGLALDLEWALDHAGRTWWLQARPITARREAPPLPDAERACPEAREGPITVWSRINVRETLPDPLLPLAWSFWRELVLPVFGRSALDFPPQACVRRELQVADLVEGRLYFNLNALLGLPFYGALARRMFHVVDPEWAEGLRAIGARVVPRSVPAGPVMRLRAGLRALRRMGAALARARNPEAALRGFEAGAREARARAREPLAGRSDAELVAAMREAVGPRLLDAPQLFASLLFAIGAFALAERALRRHPEARRLLGVAISGNPTTQMSVAIEELAEAARPLAASFLAPGTAAERLAALAATPDGRAWLARLEAFLEHSGQRCPGEFDLSVPRWSEDPSMLLELVCAELREPAKEGVRARLARLAAAREAALARAIAGAPAWRRPWLRATARWAERHLPLREAGKHHGLHAWLCARRLAVELGARFAARGWLDAPSDAFFLDLLELEAAAAGTLAGGALRERVAAARARHAARSERPAPSFLRSDGVPVPLAAPAPDASGALRGTGISTGRAVGPVRVLREPDASRLRPGEVLVVRLADPGWTPLFGRAAALVMEVGGVMCHAAVVARELGIPAVFGAAGATERFVDGELVCVDADAGTVARIAPREA